MKWYFKAIYQYFNFSGRARRKEFWVFILFNFFVIWLLSILNPYFNTEYLSTTSSIYSLFVFIPSVTVFLRRLHDAGKNGWNILLIFIPIIGWAWLLMLLIMVGEPKTNKWGLYPKGIHNN
tara:strand:+ start:347 stop:709 length:363 start_codon:yes stop_codon:yes gene_type:complete